MITPENNGKYFTDSANLLSCTKNCADPFIITECKCAHHHKKCSCEDKAVGDCGFFDCKEKPPINLCTLKGIDAVLTNHCEIEPCEAIKFNEIKNEVGNKIKYTPNCGKFEIFEKGTYLIDISANVNQKCGCVTSLALKINQQIVKVFSSYVRRGSLCGKALVTVDSIPSTLEVVNNGDKSICLDHETCPCANIIITYV